MANMEYTATSNAWLCTTCTAGPDGSAIAAMPKIHANAARKTRDQLTTRHLLHRHARKILFENAAIKVSLFVYGASNG